MPPSLYGVLEKRNWAEHHLKVIEQSISDFFNSDPYPIMTDRNPEKGVYHARLIYPKKLPARRIALLIGDCVHNMRSALDYIAWELAGGKIADTETMFPIFDTEIGFKARGLKRITSLSTDAKTAIERLQPYNTRYGGHQLALSAINKLDVTDKHKLLTVAIAFAEAIDCKRGVPGHVAGRFRTDLRLNHARLIHNATIATLTVSPPIPEMEVEFKFMPQVEFGEVHGFPKHSFVVENLKIMLKSVDTVIKRLEKFFPGSTVKG